MVLSAAGFGKEISWKSTTDVPQGYRMDFTRALYLVSARIVIGFIVPAWAMGLTAKLRETRDAYDDLGVSTLKYG